ncbi:uncharacterized protein K452DRAFT_305284 [Aplosporella prunicola CBS 121167]|uniref:Protein YAE1 n=1 Tax=Aplosporella prunicola CBS 121167 TaxID=1176127 RepID=A0A6A6BQD8_9PEZI|nr:uncharacterized protein K452DRAFT_305284 [Aplosporella prunicola CBS 121167]KAF2146342.1 hypothetical protein K452DRAFT_305284 [Aplosporella prunicola CBS 121167]
MLREATAAGDRSPTSPFGSNGSRGGTPAPASTSATATALDDIFGDEAAPEPPAVQHRLDDVFGDSSDDNDDDNDDGGVQQRSNANADANGDNDAPSARRTVSDIPRLRSVHVTAGYRDGIASSKSAHVQAGFDEGYPLGAVLGLRAGWLLGVLEGVAVALRGVGGERFEVARDRVRDARRELDVGVLCGEEYFDAEGVWRFSVGEGEGVGEVTFETVAAAHPALVRWAGVVASVAGEEGVDLGVLDRRPADRGDEEEGVGEGVGEEEVEAAKTAVVG